MSIAAMVLGILAIYTKLVVSSSGLAFLLAGIGLILGIVALVKNKSKDANRSMAIAGLIMSVIVVGLSAISVILNLVSTYYKWIFWMW